jgi:magnesium and cobalt transporter
LTQDLWHHFQRFFKKNPTNRAELLEILRIATTSEVLQPDDLRMFEGVLLVSQMRAEEIMIPYSQMVTFEKDSPLDYLLQTVIEAQHSRYPVIGDRRDEVPGIILAKDLLKYTIAPQEEFNIRDILRPAIFVPQNKRLNVLLAEFRQTKNHMAMVVDEYGNISGLITIEDILEQIVGDIRDEHDIDEDQPIRQQEPNVFLVKGNTPLTSFNHYFQTQLQAEDCDTIGGFILETIGYIPERGEKWLWSGLEISILHADTRRIYLLQCQRSNDAP